MSEIAQKNYGKSAFTAEELAAEEAAEQKRKEEFERKMNEGFFQDGITRKVVFDSIEKEEKVSKRTNNPYVLHTYLVRDTETGQAELHADRNFAMTNAFAGIKKQLGVNFRYGLTVMEMTVTKTGEREFNGFTYPEWGFEFALVGDVGEKPKAPAVDPLDEPVRSEDVPF